MGVMMSEKIIQNAILEWLSLLPNCVSWPNDSVGIWDPVKKTYRRRKNKFYRRGVSDILGCWCGRFFAIEVKSKNGRVTPEQQSFIDDVNAIGGVAFVARSIDDVEKVFRKGR